MRRFAICLTTLSLILLSSSGFLALTGCAPKPPVVVAVKTLCTSIDRYHTTEPQRTAAKRDPDLWHGLFAWLAGVDLTYDKECAA